MNELRGKLFAALTGQKADVAGQVDGDVKGMLLAIGGSSSRTKSGVDLSKAAKRLGVSRRTVERWVKADGQKPSAQNARRLASKSRQAASTKAGRRAARKSSSVGQAISSRGARVTITDFQGPRAKSYMRFRQSRVDLDPEDAEAMLDAWENGGEAGFMQWATSHWDVDYLADWKFTDPEEIDVERLDGGSWH